MWLLGHPDPSHLSSFPWEGKCNLALSPVAFAGPHGTPWDSTKQDELR